MPSAKLVGVSQLPDSAKLCWSKSNPKRPGTSAWKRFERYRGSRTVREFRDNKGWVSDFANDLKKGFVWVKGSQPVNRNVPQLGMSGSRWLKRKREEREPLKRPAGTSIARNPGDRDEQTAYTTIACLGDSNTKSCGPSSWPKELQRNMDRQVGPSACRVHTFGRPGALAAATAGKKHFGSDIKFARALALNADVYIIMLGTNDCVGLEDREPLRAVPGICELVASLRAVSSLEGKKQPLVILVQPPGLKPKLFNNVRIFVRSGLWELADEQGGVHVVDAELSMPKYYVKDYVHLSALGASKIASVVAAVLIKQMVGQRPSSSSSSSSHI